MVGSRSEGLESSRPVWPIRQAASQADKTSLRDSSTQRVFILRDYVAEREGFEPSVEILSLRRFSKPLPSATRPPLRANRLQGIMPAMRAGTVVLSDHRRRGVILHQPQGTAQESASHPRRIREGGQFAPQPLQQLHSP